MIDAGARWQRALPARMGRQAHVLVGLLFALLAFCAIAQAAELPALTGRVVDSAGMMSPADRAALAGC